ncbi:MAG: hypothetical protein JW716_05495 [Candidatus Aenigmarchaeota archaeon]|nr:hypothetical protein [Candidatus Aenigmarchaeota archaeon]
MKGKLLLWSVIFLFLILNVAAQSVTINMPDIDYQTFAEGDDVRLTATITNDGNETIDIMYQEVVLMPETPPMPVLEVMTLEPGETKEVSDLSFTVFSLTEPGMYYYSVSVRDEEWNVIAEESTPFYINGTLRTFGSIETYFCADGLCDDVRAIFIQDEAKSYLHIELEVDAVIMAQITYPDNSKSPLAVSNGAAEINFRGAGLYLIDLTFTKDGYETKTRQVKMSVMEEEPVIHYEFCSTEPDDECDMECPDGSDPDCSGQTGDQQAQTGTGTQPGTTTDGGQFMSDSGLTIVIILIAVLVAIIVYGLFIFPRRKMHNIVPTDKEKPVKKK